MTFAEFKLWFEGYTEEIDVPTESQWKRIQEQLAKVQGDIPFTPYVPQRYYQPNLPSFIPHVTYPTEWTCLSQNDLESKATTGGDIHLVNSPN